MVGRITTGSLKTLLGGTNPEGTYQLENLGYVEITVTRKNMASHASSDWIADCEEANGLSHRLAGVTKGLSFAHFLSGILTYEKYFLTDVHPLMLAKDVTTETRIYAGNLWKES